MATPIKVPPKDIRLDGNGNNVVVNNASFADAVNNRQKEVLDILSTAAPSLKMSDVAVGNDGKVTINSKELHKVLKDQDMHEHAASASALDNGACGAGC